MSRLRRWIFGPTKDELRKEREAKLLRSRDFMIAMIEQYERKVEALNVRYGFPRGYRTPSSKTFAERVAAIDVELAQIAKESEP